jgi:para-nitrobenzyl esterase
MFKSDHRPYYEEIGRMRASGTNAALLGDLMSDAMFRIGSLRMTEARADQRRPAYVYQFTAPRGRCLAFDLRSRGRGA